MLLSTFFQEIIDVAKSEQTSRPVRICCIAVTSLVFVIAIASLYLVAFVVEGPGLLRRIGFFLLGSGALGYRRLRQSVSAGSADVPGNV